LWKHGFSNATIQTRGAAAGLAYLHGSVPPVIHGDIHCVRSSWFRKRNIILTILHCILQGNVLVNSEGNVQLCDFGLSRIQHEVSRTRTKTLEGGYARHQAPEIISGDDERLKITPQTDIYALAMTSYELGAGTRPLDQYENPHRLWKAVLKGERPTGPDGMVHLSNAEKEDIRIVWPLLELMWAHEPTSRPSAVDVFEELRGRNRFGVRMPPAHIHPMYAAYNRLP
jgi:serine/threonine protein kinase